MRKHAAGGANLDHVGAVLDGLADFVLHGFHAVGNASASHVIFEGQQILVAVPSGDAERRAADQHARARNIAGIDGIAQRDVAVAVRSHVADRGESGLQSEARVAGPGQRGARNGNAQSLEAVVLRVTGQVGVGVGQTGQNGSV